jgi:hypothetical protein
MLAEWARRAADGSDSDEEGGGHGNGHGGVWKGHGKNRRRSVEMRAGELVPPVGVLHYSAGKVRPCVGRSGFGVCFFCGQICLTPITYQTSTVLFVQIAGCFIIH